MFTYHWQSGFSYDNTWYWYLDRLLAKPLTREALALGAYKAFDRAVERVMGFAREEAHYSYSFSLSRLYRSVRSALYAGSAENFISLLERRYGSMADCYPENHPYNPFENIAANPLDTDFRREIGRASCRERV